MWNVMKSNPKDLLIKSTADGIKKIKNENFALLCESKLIEYMIERDCELVQVGGLLDDKTYGLGTPNSNYKDFEYFINF
jgi:ionotropic glutamate receptor